MLSDEDYSKALKKPIKDMTIGDVVEYFDIICARKHGGDEDVKRTASELKARFMAEAVYKYYNRNESQSETSIPPAREECKNWGETNVHIYPPNSRAVIVRELTNKFKEDLFQGKVSSLDKKKNFYSKSADHQLTLSIEDDNLVITYYIGDTIYTKRLPVDSSDFIDKSSSKFWKKYGDIIMSSSNELVAQINEGH